MDYARSRLWSVPGTPLAPAVLISTAGLCMMNTNRVNQILRKLAREARESSDSDIFRSVSPGMILARPVIMRGGRWFSTLFAEKYLTAIDDIHKALGEKAWARSSIDDA